MGALLGLGFLFTVYSAVWLPFYVHGFLLVYSDATCFHSYSPPVSFLYIFRSIFPLMVPGSVFIIVSGFFTYSADFGFSTYSAYFGLILMGLIYGGPYFFLNGRPLGTFPPTYGLAKLCLCMLALVFHI